jgi:Clp amino terminal domain, pathogenicity island component
MAVNDLDLDQIIAALDAAQAKGKPLDRVSAARAAAERLEAFAQHLVAHFVDEARRDGASWTDIGAALGVTRQAAQQRFVPADGVDVAVAADQAGIPYTPRAAAALVGARDVAAERHQSPVEDIHLLLALLDNRSGGAIGAVKGLGQRTADVRKAARAQLGPDGSRRSGKNPPLGRSAVKALDVGIREALRMGGTEVGTEHLLLALAADPQSPAGVALAESGLTYANVRALVARQAKGSATAQRRTRSRRS